MLTSLEQEVIDVLTDRRLSMTPYYGPSTIHTEAEVNSYLNKCSVKIEYDSIIMRRKIICRISCLPSNVLYVSIFDTHNQETQFAETGFKSGNITRPIVPQVNDLYVEILIACLGYLKPNSIHIELHKQSFKVDVQYQNSVLNESPKLTQDPKKDHPGWAKQTTHISQDNSGDDILMGMALITLLS